MNQSTVCKSFLPHFSEANQLFAWLNSLRVSTIPAFTLGARDATASSFSKWYTFDARRSSLIRDDARFSADNSTQEFKRIHEFSTHSSHSTAHSPDLEIIDNMWPNLTHNLRRGCSVLGRSKDRDEFKDPILEQWSSRAHGFIDDNPFQPLPFKHARNRLNEQLSNQVY